LSQAFSKYLSEGIGKQVIPINDYSISKLLQKSVFKVHLYNQAKDIFASYFYAEAIVFALR